MNVSFILNGIHKSPSGGMKVIYEYANYLAKKGHTVTLYYNSKNILSKFKIPPLTKKKLSYAIISFRPRWIKLDNNIQKKLFCSPDCIENSDAVIATYVLTANFVSSLPESKGKKFYLIQGFDNWNVPDDEVIQTYKLGLINITVSKWLQKLVEEHSKKKAICISNSINTDVFKIINPVISRKKHSICFHFRSEKNKGCKDAIAAIEKLHDKYPDLLVYVVSVESKPNYMPDFVIYKKNLSPREVANVNNQCSVFLCSSIEEGFGLPGLEAMACGCALVSTEYLGVLEYAVNNENALLSPVHDSDALFHNVCKLFENEDLRLKIVNNGLLTAAKRSLDVSCRKFEDTLIEYM